MEVQNVHAKKRWPEGQVESLLTTDKRLSGGGVTIHYTATRTDYNAGFARIGYDILFIPPIDNISHTFRAFPILVGKWDVAA